MNWEAKGENSLKLFVSTAGIKLSKVSMALDSYTIDAFSLRFFIRSYSMKPKISPFAPTVVSLVELSSVGTLFDNDYLIEVELSISSP
jgi:hypothetical protein